MTDPTMPATPAGWYHDGVASGQERYWDGTAWTEHFRPLAVAPGAAPTEVIAPATGAAYQAAGQVTALAEAPPKKKRKWPWIVGASVAAVILIPAIASAGNRDSDPESAATTAVSQATEEPRGEATETAVPDVADLTAKEASALIENAGLKVDFQASSGVVLDQDNWTVTGTTPAAGEKLNTGATVVVQVTKTEELQAAAAPEAAAPVAPAAPDYTLAQQNAIRQAQSYLRYSGFSRVGLIGQLEYEGYTTEEATFGADNAGADWGAEAAEKAKSYMEYSSFSREGLYDQMAYEGFTEAEIMHGLAAVGY